MRELRIEGFGSSGGGFVELGIEFWYSQTRAATKHGKRAMGICTRPKGT